jgi:probable phosphoglycerate mutase
MCGDRMVGLIEIDPDRAKEHGAGWMTLCYMMPEYRGMRLAVQLIGHAASLFRAMGRKTLRLHVAQSNKRAINFYKHYGFKQIGLDEGVLSKLLLMEKDISPGKASK